MVGSVFTEAVKMSDIKTRLHHRMSLNFIKHLYEF